MPGLQLVGEAAERARHSHSGGIDGLGLKLTSNFRKAPLHFNSRHDELAIARIEAAERLTIAIRTPRSAGALRAARFDPRLGRRAAQPEQDVEPRDAPRRESG